MGRRTTKAETRAFGWLIIIGLPIALVMQLGKSAGWGVVVLVSTGIIGLCMWRTSVKTKKRRKELMEKYNDPALVDSIMQKKIWQGQTTDQLLDSLGKAADIDEKVLKTKTKVIWKYNHRGANRYGLRITFGKWICYWLGSKGLIMSKMNNFRTKILRQANNLDEYKLYSAALEWDLTDPIVIENANDFKIKAAMARELIALSSSSY